MLVVKDLKQNNKISIIKMIKNKNIDINSKKVPKIIVFLKLMNN